MKDRIKQLLIGGLKASEIASVVGCTPAYISQLLAVPEFKEEVEAGRILSSKEKTEEEHIEQRYQNLEHKLISSISEDIPNADFNQKLRALDIVGRRYDERKKIRIPSTSLTSLGGTPAPFSSTTNSFTVVNIGLPSHVLAQQVAPVVEMNEAKEIIAIDNKPLAPLASEGVKSIFKKLLEKAALKTAQAKEKQEKLAQIDKSILDQL